MGSRDGAVVKALSGPPTNVAEFDSGPMPYVG